MSEGREKYQQSENETASSSHKAAHEWAKHVGEKLGQPKRTTRTMPDQPAEISTRDALGRFNKSVPRPILDAQTSRPTGEFDVPNIDRFPTKAPAELIAARRSRLEEAARKTQDENELKQIRAAIADIPSVEEFPTLLSSEPSPKLLEELADVQLRVDPKTGQKLNTIFVNRSALRSNEALQTNPSQAVSVYFGPYANVVGEDDESRLRILEVAMQMPDRAIISFDYPNMGGSQRMTSEQRSTNQEDSYFAIADAQLRILKDMGVTRINTFGISMGGYAAITMAARADEYGITVDNVIAIGTPGMKAMSLPTMAAGEGKALSKIDLYHSSPVNTAMYDATHTDGEIKKPPATDIVKKDPWFRYARMMTKQTIPERASMVLESQPDARLLFVNGSEDTVSPLPAVTQVVKDLQSNYGKARVSQVIQFGENHLAMVHPKHLAPLIHLQLDSTFLPTPVSNIEGGSTEEPDNETVTQQEPLSFAKRAIDKISGADRTRRQEEERRAEQEDYKAIYETAAGRFDTDNPQPENLHGDVNDSHTIRLDYEVDYDGVDGSKNTTFARFFTSKPQGSPEGEVKTGIRFWIDHAKHPLHGGYIFEKRKDAAGAITYAVEGIGGRNRFEIAKGKDPLVTKDYKLRPEGIEMMKRFLGETLPTALSETPPTVRRRVYPLTP